MKKVVLCIPSLATAGAEKFVVDLAINLSKRNYKVYVAITRKLLAGAFVEMLKEKNIEIVDLTGKNYWEMTRKQMWFFRQVKPDVIHANVGSMFHVMLAAKLTRIKTKIYTVHNEARLLYGNNKVRKVCYRLAFHFFGFTPVAICESVKATMVKEFGDKYQEIPCVHNGVDIIKYKPKQGKELNHVITIINTGSMYWIKNQEIIIKAFANIHSKYNNVRLVILGDGVKREDLKKIVVDNNLSDVIQMPGICSNVNEYLQTADIYVSASLTEGLPLSMLEAMACGLPVITSDAGGSVDLVKTGINGIVYSKNNRTLLEKSFEKLITDEKLRLKYAVNSRKIAEKWSIENCVLGYEKLYEN